MNIQLALVFWTTTSILAHRVNSELDPCHSDMISMVKIKAAGLQRQYFWICCEYWIPTKRLLKRTVSSPNRCSGHVTLVQPVGPMGGLQRRRNHRVNSE
ncbi:Hypothetical protein CINCED_3A016563 [Cinara cedri]|uniref:Secreted protein n=1 Tax=Cinara cedri TaxID=506608 RepID=A0A5E4N321_9HEMI|nr:Hypothetical protein CINCED_3A016563 [Cinara cedri]